MTVTLKDIAQKLGLAISTVSMALNDNPAINENTRQLVKETAESMNYRPNLAARGLVKRKTHLIGLIIPDIHSSFYPSIIQGIEDYIGQYDYSLILCGSQAQSNKEEHYLNLLMEKRVDGIIIHPQNTPLSDFFKERFTSINIPTICILEGWNELKVPQIIVDNYVGARQAAEYLVELGHKKIALINGPKQLGICHAREAGLKDVLKEKNLTVPDEWNINTNFNFPCGCEAMKKILALGEDNRPTAIFVAADIMAIGAIQEARKAGLRIPDDISIIGFDGLFIGEISEISLTTMDQPKYKLGELAAEKLFALINGQEIDNEVMYTDLIVRGSTAAPSVLIPNG